MNPLKEKYEKEIKAKLKKDLAIENDSRIPTVEKIIVNSGIGKEFRVNKGIVEEMTEIIETITGQKPVVVDSKEAISNFKLRENTPNGVKVTLRKEKMWDFLYKLINFTLPRVKDFRGVPRKSFDGRGNYSLGFDDHTVFPEIDPNAYAKLRTLQVVIVTSAEDDASGITLLEALGMPFKKAAVQNN